MECKLSVPGFCALPGRGVVCAKVIRRRGWRSHGRVWARRVVRRVRWPLGGLQRRPRSRRRRAAMLARRRKRWRRACSDTRLRSGLLNQLYAQAWGCGSGTGVGSRSAWRRHPACRLSAGRTPPERLSVAGWESEHLPQASVFRLENIDAFLQCRQMLLAACAECPLDFASARRGKIVVALPSAGRHGWRRISTRLGRRWGWIVGNFDGCER